MSEISLKRRLVRALEDGDVVRVRDLLEAEREAVSEASMELVSTLCSYLSPHTLQALPHLATCCQDSLVTVARAANPKEVLVSLLEQLDSFQSSELVVKILPSLAAVLARVKPSSMSVSWSWALSTLATHLATCPTPPDLGLEGAERLTLDQAEAAQQCAQLCAACLELAESLVSVVISSGQEPDNKHRRAVIISFLLSILSPLSTLSQHSETSQSDEQISPVTRYTADKLMKNVSTVTTNNWIDILHFPSPETRETFSETADLDPVSLPTYIYFLLGEEMCQDKMPAIYTNIYLLRSSAVHIVTLLKQNNQIRVHKGLLLLQKLLTKFRPNSLTGDSGCDPSLLSLFPPLFSVIVYQEVEELRRLGFSCYSQLVRLFSLDARFSLYKYLLNTINHSGLLGWTITNLKDSIATNLTADVYIEDYAGTSLSELVSPLFKLKHGAATDLLEVSDEVIATLNFVQFLLVRDKTNRTGILDWKDQLTVWVGQMTEGLDMSIAHYQQKLREPQDEAGPAVGVSVGGRELPAMDSRQTREVLLSALTTFDIIQYNLGRVKDLLNKF